MQHQQNEINVHQNEGVLHVRTCPTANVPHRLPRSGGDTPGEGKRPPHRRTFSQKLLSAQRRHRADVLYHGRCGLCDRQWRLWDSGRTTGIVGSVTGRLGVCDRRCGSCVGAEVHSPEGPRREGALSLGDQGAHGVLPPVAMLCDGGCLDCGSSCAFSLHPPAVRLSCIALQGHGHTHTLSPPCRSSRLQRGFICPPIAHWPRSSRLGHACACPLESVPVTGGVLLSAYAVVRCCRQCGPTPPAPGMRLKLPLPLPTVRSAPTASVRFQQRSNEMLLSGRFCSRQ